MRWWIHLQKHLKIFVVNIIYDINSHHHILSKQNGVTEIKNQTILNTVRSMINIKNIPKEFWVEAVSYVVYIFNQCPPTLSLKNKTPWRIPSISYFKIFECISYTHIPDKRETMLEDKNFKLIFIRYNAKSKVYKVFDITTQILLL